MSTRLSNEERYKVLEREGSSDCVLCGAVGVDLDHAFVLGNNSKRFKEEVLNRSWNCHVLCRSCHIGVTYPTTIEQFNQRLELMQKALHRAYDEYGGQSAEAQQLYKLYKEKLVFVKQKTS